MKKIVVSAFCLALCLTATTSVAVNTVSTTIPAAFKADGRQVIKNEELPETIKKALAGEAYKGWIVKEAALVTTADASYYEVTITDGKENKALKFKNDGTLIN